VYAKLSSAGQTAVTFPSFNTAIPTIVKKGISMQKGHSKLICFAIAAACVSGAAQSAGPTEESRASYSQASGKVGNRDRDFEYARYFRGKNVILFVGDGMGVSTVTAARILEGQNQGSAGEENSLAFDTFQHTALIKTYSVNQQTSDSAPTATAMVTGYKTNDGAIAVASGVDRGESNAAKIAPFILETILEQAEARGLATGVVSTARITHATPAVNYAHIPNRDWERAGQLPAGATVLDIAAQLIARQKKGDGIEVVLGGGREMFLPTNVADPEYATRTGRRTDGRNLTQEWAAAQPKSAFVWNKAQFDAINPNSTKHLFGLFEPSHMQYEVDRANDGAGEPSLAQMTAKAIQMLSKNRKGFYMMVEAGRIDHGHHAGNAYRALTDTVALSDAVRTAMRMTDREDTLILVTADHSHVFTIAGYPERGNPILGLVKVPNSNDFSKDFQGRPYTTVSYSNGPGYASLATGGDIRSSLPPSPGRVVDLSIIDTMDEGFHQESLVGLSSETHAGEDVALYARGPKAYLVGGTMEQNEIYHVIRAALGF
jgi:alkaline phosphatase